MRAGVLESFDSRAAQRIESKCRLMMFHTTETSTEGANMKTGGPRSGATLRAGSSSSIRDAQFGWAIPNSDTQRGEGTGAVRVT